MGENWRRISGKSGVKTERKKSVKYWEKPGKILQKTEGKIREKIMKNL